MSGANITCANCRKVFWHNDDAAQAQAFLNHKCAETKRSQTVTNYSSVPDDEWAAFVERAALEQIAPRDRLAERADREGWHTTERAKTQARLNHPSSYSPDGAA